MGIRVLSVESPSIAKNLIDEPSDQLISVYLPPDYDSSEKLYPTVYYLHGFSGSPIDIRHFKIPLDRYFETHPDEAFIVVGVDGLNKLGGSFYANNESTGRWEDFLNIEVIPFIESFYRVSPLREHRGLAGFSMGGAGVVNIGLANPEIYGSFLASGAGLFDPNGLEKALQGWNDGFLRAYGTAFSPRMENRTVLGYEVPLLDGSANDHLIAGKWQKGFGDLQEKIDLFVEKNIPMDISILCGSYDSYEWIREGSLYFSNLLAMASLEHEYIVFDGGHEFNGIIINDYLIPFFTESFQ